MSKHVFWAHTLFCFASFYSFLRFRLNKNQLEKVQRKKLKHILSQLTGTQTLAGTSENYAEYEDFTQAFAVTTYKDWQAAILRQMRQGEQGMVCYDCHRYQPTSGSTDTQKWIPYSKALLTEFGYASSAWLFDVYRANKTLLTTKHYWSLSWLPDNQRTSQANLNDGELFSIFKRYLLGRMFVVPESVSLAKTDRDAMIATACFLCAEKRLGLISVWSPSFALNLLETILRHKEYIQAVLASGSWGVLGESLKQTKAPFAPKRVELLQELVEMEDSDFWKIFWPQLTLVSCWDTALAKTGAIKLKKILTHATLQGKGLWSTESVVSIPFASQYPLAYQSHFYEFECAETALILPSWQLSLGMKVIPIVTTGSGLIRYKNNDLIEVTGFYGDIPSFTFLSRIGHNDFVGEKLANEFVAHVIQHISIQFPNSKPLTLLACEDKKPKYVLILDGIWRDDLSAIKTALASLLRTSFHYNLARDLGQLAPEEVLYAENAHQKHLELMARQGLIKGQVKIEAITVVKKIEDLNLFYEH
ncbi:GH3 auxin-responsive promoter family protein [Paraglaciecola sp. 25GB23A]|uniref:GH3 family domain-containing protein n=1 Tax=Paraglaciecola sp. 25GB23A TaxID=3156068 RepID=UPI0032B02143